MTLAKNCKIILGTIFLFAIAYLSFTEWVAPSLLKQEIQKFFAKNCPDCAWEMESGSLSLLQRKVTLREIDFQQGDPFFTSVKAHVSRLVIHFSLRPLFSQHVELRQIEIDSPDVTVTEGDGKNPDKKEDRATVSPWRITGESTSISQGSFTYNRVYPGKTATLRINEISGKISAWDSKSQQLPTKGEVRAVLEHTGQLALAVEAPIFANKHKINIELAIQDQNLADLNPFFQPSDGIELKGSLYHGQGSVTVLGATLDAWVQAKYLGLDIHFQKTNQRSGLTAFFSNLVESLQVDKSNTKKSARSQIRGVSLRRAAQESLVSFILRGMREAALRVAKED